MNNERSETLEQGTEFTNCSPGAAALAAPCSGCVHGVCVCVHLDGLNSEHKFRVWVTILGHTSLKKNTASSANLLAADYHSADN